jgi:hypothetical protein
VDHSYEEIREVVVEILLGRETVAFPPSQWRHLHLGVAEVFERRETQPGQPYNRHHQATLRGQDAELVRDVFWDLFRQGFITLGMNDNNAEWPFFRLSYFGAKTLATQSPYRFHDTNSFLSLLKTEVPDISSEAVTYLDEAVGAFYAGCLLASCVMLGVAAEVEFLRLAELAALHPTHGTRFSAVANKKTVHQKIMKFHECLKPILPDLPHKAIADLEANLLAIQSVLRIARNEAGHPTGAKPERENVYVYLQLFVPFARQLMRLRQALA